MCPKAGPPRSPSQPSAAATVFDLCLLIVLDRRARTHQVAVAKYVVDTTDRWPVLAFDQGRNRVHRLFAAVGVSPFADHFSGGVRGEQVLLHPEALGTFTEAVFADLVKD